VDHIINEEVFRRVGEERSFLKALKMRRAKLIGHTLRYNNLLGRIIERKKGRPSLKYISQVVRDIGCGIYYERKRKT